MKNEEFYRRIQLPKREIYIPEKSFLFWVVFIGANVFAILVVPFSVAFKNTEDYFRLLSLSAAIAVLLNAVYFWLSDILPYLNTRRGFFWRGVFTIAGKESGRGHKYLILKPGHDHRVRVKKEFFYSVQENDRILLDRSYLGGIRKVRQISGFSERIKKIHSRQRTQRSNTRSHDQVS